MGSYHYGYAFSKNRRIKTEKEIVSLADKMVSESSCVVVEQRFFYHTITDFHYTLQFTMSWSNDYFHMFRIHGKQYWISRVGGLSFSDDLFTVRLDGFRLRMKAVFKTVMYKIGLSALST